MFDGLLLEGALLPLRTAAALVPTLAAGLLVGTAGTRRSSGRVAHAPAGRFLVPAFASLALGAAAGLVLPAFGNADALSLAALGLGVVLGATVAVARLPPAPLAWALLTAAAFLAARTSFGRFLPGELPLVVYAGAFVGIVVTAVAATGLVGAVRALVRGPIGTIGPRVAASWLVAVGLLQIALAVAAR